MVEQANSTAIMKKFILALLAFVISTCSVSARNCYWKSDSFKTNTSFFDAFQFETFDDPTHGYVDYVDRNTAFQNGLVKYIGEKVYIGVDYSNTAWGRGRRSIRLKSNRVLNGRNLLVIDLDHMPSTTGQKVPAGCGVWPAFWTVGDNWPNNGEIDIIEYVNTDSTIQTTLHTGWGCDQGPEGSPFSGNWAYGPNGQPSDDCYIYADGQYSNAGCGIFGPGNTVGNSFNQRGNGGVYVMEWDSDNQIRTFFFARDQVPWDLQEGRPNPDSWGSPYARFAVGWGTSCSPDHFQNHNVIFDTTFCGDWAGSNFAGPCGGGSISCQDFVQNFPWEFSEAYWLLNYVDVYDAC